MRTALILASTSAIRRELLTKAGVTFEAMGSPLDEEAQKLKLQNQAPETWAQSLATAKALATSQQHREAIVIGADQTLILDNRILSKPKSRSEARQHLSQLRGKPHDLISALAITQGDKIIWQHQSTATLHMRDFSDDFLDTYLSVASDDILTSVGSYQLEGSGIQLFSKIEGDYFTILGLPLLPLLAQLRAMGLLAS